MSKPLYFGVELEFCIGFLQDLTEPLPEVAKGRTINFAITQDNKFQFDRNYEPIEACECRNMAQHLKQTISSVTPPSSSSGPSWEIGYDSTIEEPRDRRFEWFMVEVTSPPLPFTPESIAQVARVCDILNEKYVLRVTKTCGVHVHVSGGCEPAQTLDFPTMQKLAMFLWSFEPQLESIHPPSRIGNRYCKSWSSASHPGQALSQDLSSNFVLNGVRELKKAATMWDLFSTLFGTSLILKRHRYLAYNMQPMIKFLHSNSDIPTVEFRQRKGTIEAEEVCNWIKIVCGVVEFCRDVETRKLDEKIMKVQTMLQMEKTTAAENVVVEVDVLTMIELLEWMGMKDSADYYRGRLFLPSEFMERFV